MFIISTNKFDDFKYKINNFYINYDEHVEIIETEDYSLIFEGYLYPDINYTIEDIIEYYLQGNNSNSFKKFKGNYCGVFYNKILKTVEFFNDQLGLSDIYYFHKGNTIVITNLFSKILNVLKPSISDIDEVAISEFIAYENVLNQRTFLKDVKILPLASTYTLDNSKLIKKRYWSYENKPAESLDSNRNEIVDRLDYFFNQSINRIKKINKGKTFGIGLSGGLDSALTSYYAKKNGMKLRCFCFGHKNSDAFRAAKKIANELDIDLILLQIKEGFLEKMWYDGLSYDPMINQLYLSYCSLNENLPYFDILLTGFNGDNLFGSHIKRSDLYSRDNCVKHINKTYNLYPLYNFKDGIREEICMDIKESDISDSTWINAEYFNYNNRQLRFIKNNFSFNYLGKYCQSYSIFTDIDLVEYVLSFPVNELYQSKLYYDFISMKIPFLADIRPERKSYKLSDPKALKLLKKLIYRLELKTGLHLFYNVSMYHGHLNWKSIMKYDEKFIVNLIQSQQKGNPLEYLKDSFLNKIQNENISMKEIQALYLYASYLLFYKFIEKT